MSRRTTLSAALAMVCAAVMATVLGTPAFGAAAAPGQTSPPPRVVDNPREFALPTVPTPATQPESVVYDARSRSFYASSSNGGSISKVTFPQGVATTFLPPGRDSANTPDGRTEANGLAIDTRNRLYVAGGNSGHLYVYDLGTGRRVADFDTASAGFVNDVAVSPRTGEVYFTDSRNPRIYRVTAAQVAAGGGAPQVITTSPETTSLPAGTNSAKPFNNNGIRFTPDGRFIVFDDLNDAALYVMTIPPANAPAQRQIFRVPITNGSLGDADGLEFVGQNLYVTDNGGERVLKLGVDPNMRGGRILDAVTSPKFHTPTQAALAPGNVLLVPQAQIFEPAVPPLPSTVDAIPLF